MDGGQVVWRGERVFVKRGRKQGWSNVKQKERVSGERFVF